VAVSHRVRSLQAAHQIGTLIVTPFVLVVVAQIGGTLTFDLPTVTVFGAVVWVVAAIALELGCGQLRPGPARVAALNPRRSARSGPARVRRRSRSCGRPVHILGTSCDFPVSCRAALDAPPDGP
jgi:hypothetical protein